MAASTPRPSETAADQSRAMPEGMILINQQPSFEQYLVDLWDRREFIVRVPIEELRSKNMDTALGNIWLLLTPMLSISVYFIIFGLLLDISRGLPNYLGFLTIGYLFFQFIGRGLPKSAVIIQKNQSLIQSVHFPRASLVFSSALQDLFAFLPALYVMLVMVLLSGMPGDVPNEGIRLQWLLLIPLMMLSMMIVIGLKLIVARLGTRFTDLGQVLPHATRLVFYGSGVIYEPTRFTEGHEWANKLFIANPFYEIISLARGAILQDYAVDARYWVYATLWACALLAFGMVFFWRGELRYGF